jgi:transmembrane sensor
MERSVDPAASAIAEQAAQWFAARKTAVPTAATDAEFTAWLRASPQHVEEYLRISLIASELTATAIPPLYTVEALLADANGEPPAIAALPGRTVDARADRRRRVRPAWLGALAVAAAAAAVVWVVRPSVTPAPAPLLATGHGELRSWTLADGSTLELDVDSVAQLQFGATERRIRLDRGRLFVHVAKGDARPLRVRAGSATVEATGTQFDVRRLPQRVIVTLTEGHVRVAARADSALPASSAEGTVLNAGEQVTVMADAVSTPRRVAVDRSEAWRTGRVIADRLPLGEAVEEFRRFSSVPLTVQDRPLAALPISGSFDARDLDTFLAFLEATQGVRVVRSEHGVVIMRRKPHRAPG